MQSEKGDGSNDARAILTSHVGASPAILLPPHPPVFSSTANKSRSCPNTNASGRKSCNVRVAVRVRPLTIKEESLLSDNNGDSAIRRARSVVSVQPQLASVSIGERRFTFDSVFNEKVTQDQMYEDAVKNMLPGVLNGYNATIVAYGQTGSGKTYTMGSEHGRSASADDSRGLIPRFLSDLFLELRNIEKSKNCVNNSNTAAIEQKQYSVTASFLEVYGEDVHDLLEEERRPLPLREDTKGVTVVGLTRVPISNVTEALNVLKMGTLHRTTAATLMNMSSSRSHAVFSVMVSQFFDGDNDVSNATTSQIIFVDLAGSERVKKTGAEGERMREGIQINVGLLALGNVINALADEERFNRGEKVHVPYRQSKLTRLLQDALGGNSQTLFLACVSPAEINASETLSTMKYAHRARNIKNKPTKNVDQSVLLLKHLRVLNSIFQSELIKYKFGGSLSQEDKLASISEDDTSSIGSVSNNLLLRTDVIDYIKLLYTSAEKKYSDVGDYKPLSIMTRNTPIEQNSACNITDSRMSKLHKDTSEKIMSDDSDDDIAILDQLLELHSSVENQDEEYNTKLKTDHKVLKEVEGEIEEKDQLWQKLREKMNNFHEMKADYEKLIQEVQNLEREKQEQASLLERAQNDPTGKEGCSSSIKVKLERVERSLTRARSEARKHQELYRKAEVEAQKCRKLELQINGLKQSKVSLIKKQREAAQRYKEFTENKQREISSLKKKERKVGKQFTQLETECRRQNIALDRRNNYCNKLTGKLKKTENHLLRILQMRKKDLLSRSKNYNGRTSKHGSSRRMSSSRPSEILSGSRCNSGEDNVAFAPSNDEVASLKFLLDKVIEERIENDILSSEYEGRMSEYNCVMKLLREEVSQINLLKLENESDEQLHNNELSERELNVEDLELRLELISADIEELKLRILNNFIVNEDDEKNLDQEDLIDRREEEEMQIVKNLSGPVSRTILWEFLEDLTNSELNRQKLAQSIKRKDAALQNYELELEKADKNQKMIKDKYDRQNDLITEDQGVSIEVVDTLRNEVESLKAELEEIRLEKKQLSDDRINIQNKNVTLERNYLEFQESVTLNKASQEDLKTSEEAKKSLSELQMTWKVLGVSKSERECVRRQIETALEDTCRRKLEEATNTFVETIESITKLRKCCSMIHSALGIPEEDTKIEAENFEDLSMLDHFNRLKDHFNKLKPRFVGARKKLIKMGEDAKKLAKSLDVSVDSLSPHLQMIIAQNICEGGDEWNEIDTNAVGPPYSLSSNKLKQCEKEVHHLRHLKSAALTTISSQREKANKLAIATNFNRNDLFALCVFTLKKRCKEFPDWWDPKIADKVCGSIIKSIDVVSLNAKCTKHLLLALESLEWVESGRRILSDSLKQIIKNAYTKLLSAVEGQIDVSEALDTFNEAFSQMPSLSKDYIQSCIEEMSTIVKAAEDMLQSETEGLTVTWEALRVTKNKRGKFWGEVDEALTNVQMTALSPFDTLLQKKAFDLEDWVIKAVREATKIHRTMNFVLVKLEKIHREVQGNRELQITENRIKSLDAEIQVMGVRLAKFEEEAGNKQRLFQSSANLLKEEKYRKLSQSKLSPKLEKLGHLLMDWEKKEGSKFDVNWLSEEVRLFIQGQKSVETWVEDRTAFMHLKTTRTKRKDDSEQSKIGLSNDIHIVAKPTERVEKGKKILSIGPKNRKSSLKSPRSKQKNSTKIKARGSIRTTLQPKTNSVRKIIVSTESTNTPLKNVPNVKETDFKENLSPFGSLLATTPCKSNPFA